MKLHRCDACEALIDPAEDDELTVVEIGVLRDAGAEPGRDRECIDLCEACRPESAGALGNWLIHEIESGEETLL
jgi:hypothetical protein